LETLETGSGFTLGAGGGNLKLSTSSVNCGKFWWS